MPEQFEILDVSDWPLESVEPGGSEPNHWLWTPAGGRVLFKPVVARDGRRQGEDWAEKIVEQLAGAIGVPAARIDMAVRDGKSGLVSADLAPEGWELQAGAVLIGAIDSRLTAKARNRLGHNLTNMHAVLSGLPATAPGMSSFTAYDQVCGYLMLDAWVANPDRHEANWGVLQSPEGEVTLAGSFDHGNSLGFNLTEQRYQSLLAKPRGVEEWAARGYAVRFEDRRSTPLVDLVSEAFGLASPGTGSYWKERLAAVSEANCELVISRTPVMSAACRTFCLRLLSINKRRLLDGD
ncbi:hypothetical protein ACT8ZV_02395 [Nocardioides sp. MAHUQ-72]|uniref:hypothetical protein n=1 Tax=unclassified Nocardioides TaxID=2615069 RepID=UPI003610F932